MSTDRDPAWVIELARQRGYAFADLSTSSHQQYRLDGDLGGAGEPRAWTCEAHREYLADGGAEDHVRWACPSLHAAEAAHELIVSFGGRDAYLGNGDAVGDLAVVGVGALVNIFRRRNEPADLTVTDVLAVSEVHDPAGIMTDPEVLRLYRHWPQPAEAPSAWARSVKRALRVTELPADAPPQDLALGMTVKGPLGVTSRDWWNRTPWLAHQIDLGIALGRAVVAGGAYA